MNATTPFNPAFTDAERREHAVHLAEPRVSSMEPIRQSNLDVILPRAEKFSIEDAVRQSAETIRQPPTQTEPPPAPTEDPERGTPNDGAFRGNIIRMFQMVDAAVADARLRLAENSDLKARIEQMQIALNDANSRNASVELEKADMQNRLTEALQEGSRLRGIIEGHSRGLMQAIET